MCLSLSVTRPGYGFTQQNRGSPVTTSSSPHPSVSTSIPPSLHDHLLASLQEWERGKSHCSHNSRQSQRAREWRWTHNSTPLRETFTVHQPVCVCVGTASESCQTDRVLKLGQEKRCSICCLARVNIMARWPRSCTETLLCHWERRRHTAARSSNRVVKLLCLESLLLP